MKSQTLAGKEGKAPLPDLLGTAGHGEWECGGSQKPLSPGHRVYLKQFLWEAKDYRRKLLGNNNNNKKIKIVVVVVVVEDVGKNSQGSNSKSKGVGGMLAFKWGETASPGIYKAQLQVWD